LVSDLFLGVGNACSLFCLQAKWWMTKFIRFGRTFSSPLRMGGGTYRRGESQGNSNCHWFPSSKTGGPIFRKFLPHSVHELNTNFVRRVRRAKSQSAKVMTCVGSWVNPKTLWCC